MIRLIEEAALIPAAGKKRIEEFVGGVNTGTDTLSIAHMNSPGGWTEPGQRPEFDEYTIVLEGKLTVETSDKTYKVGKGQGIFVSAGEWVRYSSPDDGGADYISVCIPAFSPDTVHRDGES